MDSPEESENLDDALEETIERLSSNADQDTESERVTDAAHVLWRSAYTLDGYVPAYMELPDGWDDLLRLISDPAFRPRVISALQVELAREYCTHTADMTERCLEMTRHIVPGGPRTRRYLALLARSYISGFHTETIMLAGSLLEQELVDAFLRTGTPVPATAAGKSSINQQIDSAYRLGWLSAEARTGAKDIWHRRCKVVHEDPTLVKEASNTVHATIAVLRELCVVGMDRDEALLGELARLKPASDQQRAVIAHIRSVADDQMETRRRHKSNLRKRKGG